jgi:hypothetical protein
MSTSDTQVPTETITAQELRSVVNVLDQSAFKLKDAPYWLGIRQKLANLVEGSLAEVIAEEPHESN